MHKYALASRFVLGKLTDGFKERKPLDIPDSSSNFTEHKINFILSDPDKIFNFVGYMGDHLDGFAQIIATTFFFEHG